MKIRHVSVKNFRGIRRLEWDIKADVVCLIGPGDATKSTVLDAMAYALSHGRFLGLSDADFYGANIKEPIVIKVTVTNPPSHLLTESKYALFQRGWSADKGLSDDPDPDDDAALTVRLRVDDDLEPHWTVTKEANDEGRVIGWKDRASLQLFRIDESINTHLAWGRGSALAALTADDDEIDSTLTAASRQAREAAFAAPHEKLSAAAETAYEHAVALGVPSGSPFQPGLDAGAMGSAARLSLHQGTVPLSYAGLGTKRLVALALQRARISEGSVVLVDEIEHGLEPHRLLHLLQSLREAVGRDDDPGLGQVFLTTHSAETVAELRADELHVVRSEDGITKIEWAPDAFTDSDIDPQAITRAGAAALLARRVIVAEGRTEIGYLRAMASVWNTSRGAHIAHRGTTTMDGGGSQAAKRAIGFVRLGYETALFVDSDAPVDPPVESVSAASVEVVQWAGTVSIEERIALDLPENGLEALVQLAIKLVEDQEAVLGAIHAQLPDGAGRIETPSVLSWVTPMTTIDAIRAAIGKAAKRKKWFKGIEQAERLGNLVGEFLPQLAGSDTETKTADLERFAYAE